MLIWVGVFIIWIAPQQLVNFPPRNVRFDPSLLTNNAANYWLPVTFRFLRLVVVVPVIEEIFWRAFLLRLMIDETSNTYSSANLAGFLLRSWPRHSLSVIPARTGSRPSSAACSTTLWPTAAAAWLRAFLPTLRATCSWDCGLCRPANAASGD